jgi:plastocyanin
MKRSRTSVSSLLVPALALLAFVALPATRVAADDDRPRNHRLVAVPEEDRFSPFAITIRVGDTVEWVNNDTDDHTVVSDDAVNTAGPKNINVVIPGTGGGSPASEPFRIQFHDAGQWVYYCRFHSQIDDEYHQPFAPGPDGGIQGEKDPSKCSPAGNPNDTCNFGTPMMGVITVLPRRHEDGPVPPASN